MRGFLLLSVAAVRAQPGRYDPAAQRYQEELMRQQMRQQASQQQQAQYARQAQQEALLRAQREAMLNQARGGSGYAEPGGGGFYNGGSKPPLGKKEQRELKKKQERDAKTLQELQKTNQKLRQQAAKKRYSSTSRRAVSKRGGLAGFVLSWKGLAMVGGLAALYFTQRELLMGTLLKYPVWFASWVCRAVWSLAIKPVVRFIVLRTKGGGMLPGGSY